MFFILYFSGDNLLIAPEGIECVLDGSSPNTTFLLIAQME
jgi:hypothetical protein